MKIYPSIPRGVQRGVPVYVFDKLDGSCVMAEWTRKNGFRKFGRRNGLLDDSNPVLTEAPDLILTKYSEGLEKVFRAQRWQRATAYFEFHGPSSFAGNHVEEPHDVTLFDVGVYKKGLVEPRDFLRWFDHLDIAALLHHGNFTADIQAEVEAGALEGMTFEGVVYKGALDRKAGRPLMFKCKNRAWIDKLKSHCGDDEKLFERLL